ncbi:FHA domain-containing protein [Fodinicola acaciae]|uniref:FHA domain-containing protein n=1 Tax=Fodinicola acaciae TaxID=2681555 RepID=UPI001C9E9B9E|nr:FHA domain-containing protein [Fodinicola acaciae]
MGLSTSRPADGLAVLPPADGGLARGVPAAAPGTLFVLGPYGGVSAPPTAGFSLLFGRNEPEVHVCVGDDDPHVSRRHGEISFTGARWGLRNIGRSAIRLPGSRMLPTGQRELLPTAYTPLFVISPHQQHLVEVLVAGPEPARVALPRALSADERLVLSCLGQRYLRHEATPHPLSWSQVASQLASLRPAESWGVDRISRIVGDVRDRAVTGASVHDLLVELVTSTTLVPTDLRLLSR